ncbi:MAG: VOC family protein [Candidatus Andersenbacteria bacterium]
MMNKPNPVVHFEMPFENRDRMVKFYKDVFEWQIQLFGPEMGDYALVDHPKEDVKPDAVKGVIGGGFFKRAPENAHPSIVIGVKDIKEMMEKVNAAGGKVVESTLQNGEPMEIPGIGLYAGFTDTEGNRVSLLQPAEMGK